MVDFDKLVKQRRYYAEFSEHLQACERCPLHELPVNQPLGYKLPGHGSIFSRILFVAQNPASVRKGMNVFGGDNSNDEFFVKALWKGAELGRGEVFVTNIVKCSTLNNEAPTYDCVDTCTSQWLKLELMILKQVRTIIAVGAIAKRYFGAVEGERRMWIDLTNRAYQVYGVKHPAHYLRRGAKLEEYIDVFKELRRMGAFR